VNRHEPPRENRGPSEVSAVAQDQYKLVVKKLFEAGTVKVTDSTINRPVLKKHLEDVFARRREYYPEDIPPSID
jgi:hypothetical protein